MSNDDPPTDYPQEPPSQDGTYSSENTIPEVGGKMSFFEHLGELAGRLRKALFAYVIAFILVSSLPDPTHPFGGPSAIFGYNFLIFSLLRKAESNYAPGFQFLAMSPTDPIFAFMNISMVLALVISMPYIFHEIYGFVAPGLYRREKRAVRKYILPFAILLGIGGIFGLIVVFPIVMHILLLFYQPLGLAALLSLNSFVNLLLLVPFMTGLAFTFPVYLIPLVELRVLSVKQLTSARKWVYVLVALAVGIVNPDPTFISSIPIIVPIYALFEITVFISKRIESNRAKRMLA